MNSGGEIFTQSNAMPLTTDATSTAGQTWAVIATTAISLYLSVVPAQRTSFTKKWAADSLPSPTSAHLSVLSAKITPQFGATTIMTASWLWLCAPVMSLAILPGHRYPKRTIESTDVDCTNSTDVIDVVRMVNVAFRNADAASKFCTPCR